MKRMVLLLCRMQACQSPRRQLYASVVGTFACRVVLLLGPYLRIPWKNHSTLAVSNELERAGTRSRAG